MIKYFIFNSFGDSLFSILHQIRKPSQRIVNTPFGFSNQLHIGSRNPSTLKNDIGSYFLLIENRLLHHRIDIIDRTIVLIDDSFSSLRDVGVEVFHEEQIISLILIDNGMHSQSTLYKTSIHPVKHFSNHSSRIYRNTLRYVYRELKYRISRTSNDRTVVVLPFIHPIGCSTNVVSSSLDEFIVQVFKLIDIGFKRIISTASNVDLFNCI